MEKTQMSLPLDRGNQEYAAVVVKGLTEVTMTTQQRRRIIDALDRAGVYTVDAFLALKPSQTGLNLEREYWRLIREVQNTIITSRTGKHDLVNLYALKCYHQNLKGVEHLEALLNGALWKTLSVDEGVVIEAIRKRVFRTVDLLAQRAIQLGLTIPPHDYRKAAELRRHADFWRPLAVQYRESLGAPPVVTTAGVEDAFDLDTRFESPLHALLRTVRPTRSRSVLVNALTLNRVFTVAQFVALDETQHYPRLGKRMWVHIRQFQQALS